MRTKETNIEQWIFNAVFAARVSGVELEELIGRIRAEWEGQDELWVEGEVKE